MVLASEESRHKKLRRALRAEDQKHFDQLFEYVRLNVQAAVQAASPEPMESVFLLMLVQMQKEIHQLKNRVRELEGEEPFALVAPHEEHQD